MREKKGQISTFFFFTKVTFELSVSKFLFSYFFVVHERPICAIGNTAQFTKKVTARFEAITGLSYKCHRRVTAIRWRPRNELNIHNAPIAMNTSFAIYYWMSWRTRDVDEIE